LSRIAENVSFEAFICGNAVSRSYRLHVNIGTIVDSAKQILLDMKTIFTRCIHTFSAHCYKNMKIKVA